jgi:hypothetical protein
MPDPISERPLAFTSLFMIDQDVVNSRFTTITKPGTNTRSIATRDEEPSEPDPARKHASPNSLIVAFRDLNRGACPISRLNR